ncbi:hypothetical protein NP233_g11212 [Leucocoprinus birnbaumii]|uniref:Uncharacterized protein n=1 Tax=Leucocoprinus birnbaumii TaxID=56174 RepID=A0AAD5VKN8_9AGAR|nr:hypothetical protein NP233_g11212 [Leucocoprinus birnbaumii]
MGRKSANRKPALNDAQVIVLRGLATEALTARSEIRERRGPYYTLQEWVKAVAIPSFNSLYKTPASEYEELQIYLWFRNYCQCKGPKPQKKPEGEVANVSGGNSSGRLASHDGAGPFVGHWNNALSSKMTEITDSERDGLKKIIEVEEESWKSPPAKASIIAEQDAFTGRVSQRVQELLGWERKQFSDAACFLVVTYRDRNNTIQEFRCTISNQPQSLKFYEPFVTHYNQEMGNEFAMVSGRVLPCHEVHSLPFIDEHPDGVLILSKDVCLEGFTIRELHEMAELFLRKLWVASHSTPPNDQQPPPAPPVCSPSPFRAVEVEATLIQPILPPIPDSLSHRPTQSEVQPPLDHSHSKPLPTGDDNENMVSTTPPSSPGRNVGPSQSPVFSLQLDARSANQAQLSNSAETELTVPDLHPQITHSTDSANELLPTALPNNPSTTLSDTSNTPPKVPARITRGKKKQIRARQSIAPKAAVLKPQSQNTSPIVPVLSTRGKSKQAQPRQLAPLGAATNCDGSEGQPHLVRQRNKPTDVSVPLTKKNPPKGTKRKPGWSWEGDESDLDKENQSDENEPADPGRQTAKRRKLNDTHASKGFKLR